MIWSYGHISACWSKLTQHTQLQQTKLCQLAYLSTNSNQICPCDKAVLDDAADKCKTYKEDYLIRQTHPGFGRQLVDAMDTLRDLSPLQSLLNSNPRKKSMAQFFLQALKSSCRGPERVYKRSGKLSILKRLTTLTNTFWDVVVPWLRR